MTLLGMQRDFRAWLESGDDRIAARLGGRLAVGCDVYRNNYHARLQGCLAETFPHTRDWIGAEAFQDAMAMHVARVPPSSWTLDAYPRGFPETLAALYPADPEIAELAWIEQALVQAFIGGDAATIAVDQVSVVNWDIVTLRFVPTLDLTMLTSNACLLWAAMAGGEVPPDAEMLPDPGAVLVWRYEGVSRLRPILRDELAALLTMRAGGSFGALCAELVNAHGQEHGVKLAGTALGRWLADGLITTISEREEACEQSPPPSR